MTRPFVYGDDCWLIDLAGVWQWTGNYPRHMGHDRYPDEAEGRAHLDAFNARPQPIPSPAPDKRVTARALIAAALNPERPT